MKIILVRHGKHESETHNGKLLSKGKKQAKLLSKKLKKNSIKEIYSSDLERARETAEILKNKLKIPLTITVVLREWESKTIKQDRKKWKKEDKDNLKRLDKFLNEITKNKEENLLIVAHGQLNKIIMARLLNINPVKLVPFMQDNTGMDVLEWNEYFHNWRLILMNDTSHLDNNLSKFLIKYRK